MDKDEIIKEAVVVIRRYLPPGEFKVLLFGSWARGDARERSDVDIGILGPRAVDDILMLRIRGEVRAIPTLRRIDVVDLNKTDQSFREQVLSYAQSL